MTHQESQCCAKIMVSVVPVQTTAPVTMSRDPSESLGNDRTPLENVAHEHPEIGLGDCAQSFIGGE
jgi:hypothetical protein